MLPHHSSRGKKIHQQYVPLTDIVVAYENHVVGVLWQYQRSTIRDYTQFFSFNP